MELTSQNREPKFLQETFSIIESFTNGNTNIIYYGVILAVVWTIYWIFRLGRNSNNQSHIILIIQNLKNERNKKVALEKSITRMEFLISLVDYWNIRFTIVNIAFILLLIIEGKMAFISYPLFRSYLFNLSFLIRYLTIATMITIVGFITKGLLRRFYLVRVSRRRDVEAQAQILIETLITELGEDMQGELTSYIEENLHVRNERLKTAIDMMQEVTDNYEDEQKKVSSIFKFYESIIDQLLAYKLNFAVTMLPATIDMGYSQRDLNISQDMESPKILTRKASLIQDVIIDKNYAIGLKKYFMFLRELGEKVNNNDELKEEINLEVMMSDLDKKIKEEILNQIEQHGVHNNPHSIYDDTDTDSDYIISPNVSIPAVFTSTEEIKDSVPVPPTICNSVIEYTVLLK